VAVLRADRPGGDTKTRKSCRALKLAQIAAEALEQIRSTMRPSRRLRAQVAGQRPGLHDRCRCSDGRDDHPEDV
jgi:hypothetical protein